MSTEFQELTGSEKQIEWATRIRGALPGTMRKAVQIAELTQKHNYNLMQKPFLNWDDIRGLVDAWTVDALSNTEAAFFIDNRGDGHAEMIVRNIISRSITAERAKPGAIAAVRAHRIA